MAKQKSGSTGTQAQATPAANPSAMPVAREQMIAVAAYYLAEQRSFSPGQEVEDWLQAEKGLDAVTAGTTAETAS